MKKSLTQLSFSNAKDVASLNSYRSVLGAVGVVVYLNSYRSVFGGVVVVVDQTKWFVIFVSFRKVGCTFVVFFSFFFLFFRLGHTI